MASLVPVSHQRAPAVALEHQFQQPGLASQPVPTGRRSLAAPTLESLEFSPRLRAPSLASWRDLCGVDGGSPLLPAADKFFALLRVAALAMQWGLASATLCILHEL